MNRILFFLGTLLLVTPIVTGQEPEKLPQRSEPSSQSKWRTYTVKGEEFSVALPTLPAADSSAVFHPRLKKYRVERRLRTLLDGVGYSVDVVENPDSMQSLEDFIAEQNRNPAFDFTPERDLVVDGFPGKEYLSRNKTLPATVQFFATENRLYRFATIGSDANNEVVKQFFSSIKLAKANDATAVVDG